MRMIGLGHRVASLDFLHSAGKANSLGGDGSLSTAAPRSEPSDRYLYDPANPAPTVGWPLCCDAPFT
ncbi:MAG: hypothetical protein DMG69_23910 [Acidobacteria bacterium]|nr:MAG: hypothetical protein DMG69_23910 [Acidobacteriota bacterium]